MPTDVTDAEQCDQVVAVTVPEFGQVDVAVNNAGGASTKAPLDWEADEWSQIVDLNLAGVYFLSRAAAKRELEGGKGVIVNISSGSSCNPFPIGLPYGASKAAVNNLTNSLAAAWTPHGVRVKALACGGDRPQTARRVSGSCRLGAAGHTLSIVVKRQLMSSPARPEHRFGPETLKLPSVAAP